MISKCKGTQLLIFFYRYQKTYRFPQLKVDFMFSSWSRWETNEIIHAADTMSIKALIFLH